MAAKNGHLECLKYAHENNCPLDSEIFYYAAENGHLDCLKYVYHHKKCIIYSFIMHSNVDEINTAKKMDIENVQNF